LFAKRKGRRKLADFVVGGSMLMINILEEYYKNLTLRVVLHGCETWRLTLREEHRLVVLESTVLRRIFGLKRSEVTSVGNNYVERS
jgi:hypothetical protein